MRTWMDRRRRLQVMKWVAEMRQIWCGQNGLVNWWFDRRWLREVRPRLVDSISQCLTVLSGYVIDEIANERQRTIVCYFNMRVEESVADVPIYGYIWAFVAVANVCHFFNPIFLTLVSHMKIVKNVCQLPDKQSGEYYEFNPTSQLFDTSRQFFKCSYVDGRICGRRPYQIGRSAAILNEKLIATKW